MKIEPIFFVKDSKLYKIEDNSLQDITSFTKKTIPWSTVEMQDELYNEEYLAVLREELKSQSQTFFILCPIVDKSLLTPEQIELFINAFNHTARRIKDCENVVGFELPAELKDIQEFIDVLSVKHGQYVYFHNGVWI